jgi:hypothetical protein
MKKRTIVKIGGMLATCLIGIAAFYAWQYQHAPMPYCQVARNGDWYHNSFIRVKAKLIFGSDGMYVFEDCDPVEALASMVDLQGVEHSGRNYVEEVIVTGEKPQIKTADAIIEGWFDGNASTGCWRPKYHIAATKIELVSPVSDYQGPGDDDGKRVKH